MNFLNGIARNEPMKSLLIFLAAMILIAFTGSANDSHALARTNLTASTNTLATLKDIRDACKWGRSTNGIALGVGLWGSNQFTVRTYLMTTNSRGLAGPAPAPHGYRLGLTLLDDKGKQVIKTKAGDSICKPVGWLMRRNMHNEKTRGIYVLTPDIPRKYDDAFNLLECFNVKKPGAYTLIVTGTLYGRTATPRVEVILVDLPATSIQVTIGQGDLDDQKHQNSNVR